MEERDIIELIKKQNKELLDKQFVNGALVGWNTCLIYLNKRITPLRSANKIKKLIADFIDESQARIKNNMESMESKNENDS